MAPKATPRAANRPLYEWTGILLEIYEAIQLLEGELPPELDAKLTEALEGLEGKVDPIAAMLRQFDFLGERQLAEAKAIEALAKPHRERAKFYERRVADLERYVLLQLRLLGKDRLEGPIHRLRRQANPAKVVVDYPDQVPERFLKPREISLTALKEALDAADPEALKVAHLATEQERGEHLRVEMA